MSQINVDIIRSRTGTAATCDKGLVISDAGKTLLEGLDEVRVYCDTENGVDVNLSILKGVS